MRCKHRARPLQAIHSAALEELAPSVLVDEQHRILNLSKTAGRYIRSPEGSFRERLR
jgi:two-component system, chemotaxis family, CheB/CheR fusion protein